MKALRDLTFGLLSAIASGIIVLGAVSLALVEGMAVMPAPVVELVTPTLLIQAQEEQPTIEHTSLPGVTPSATAVATATPPSLPSICPPPTGWVTYVIEPGDTVKQLARLHSITADTLRDANCLSSDMLLPAYILYLPALPPTNTPVVIPPTITPIPCGPPWGWVLYTVRPGDTLFKLSLAYRVSVPQIQFANCMGSSTYIRYGQTLFLPYVIPIRTAVPTTMPTFTSTATTAVPTKIVLPPTATRTTAPTLTFTVVPTATNTPLIPTETFTATETPLPPTLTETPVTVVPPVEE